MQRRAMGSFRDNCRTAILRGPSPKLQPALARCSQRRGRHWRSGPVVVWEGEGEGLRLFAGSGERGTGDLQRSGGPQEQPSRARESGSSLLLSRAAVALLFASSPPRTRTIAPSLSRTREIDPHSVCDSLDPLPRLYLEHPSSSSTLVVAWCLRGFCARVQLVRANQRSRVVLSYSLLNA